MKLTTTVLTKHNYVDHIKAIEKSPTENFRSGINGSRRKQCFGCTGTSYIGLWIIKYGANQLFSKVNYIKAIDDPTKVYNIRLFIGIVDYYR